MKDDIIGPFQIEPQIGGPLDAFHGGEAGQHGEAHRVLGRDRRSGEQAENASAVPGGVYHDRPWRPRPASLLIGHDQRDLRRAQLRQLARAIVGGADRGVMLNQR